jgi:hypothetical protein
MYSTMEFEDSIFWILDLDSSHFVLTPTFSIKF